PCNMKDSWFSFPLCFSFTVLNFRLHFWKDIKPINEVNLLDLRHNINVNFRSGEKPAFTKFVLQIVLLMESLLYTGTLVTTVLVIWLLQCVLILLHNFISNVLG
ncbi:hypothetical protein OTU49_005317, partial [Cherax quadricarinatus]